MLYPFLISVIVVGFTCFWFTKKKDTNKGVACLFLSPLFTAAMLLLSQQRGGFRHHQYAREETRFGLDESGFADLLNTASTVIEVATYLLLVVLVACLVMVILKAHLRLLIPPIIAIIAMYIFTLITLAHYFPSM